MEKPWPRAKDFSKRLSGAQAGTAAFPSPFCSLPPGLADAFTGLIMQHSALRRSPQAKAFGVSVRNVFQKP